MIIHVNNGFYQKLKKYLLLALVSMIFLHISFVSGGARAFETQPFHPGEKATYKARCGVLPAGQVTMEVLPMETIDGVKAYHFAMITETNSVVDLIYKIRERQDSYIAVDLKHSDI